MGEVVSFDVAMGGICIPPLRSFGHVPSYERCRGFVIDNSCSVVVRNLLEYEYKQSIQEPNGRSKGFSLFEPSLLGLCLFPVFLLAGISRFLLVQSYLSLVLYMLKYKTQLSH